MIGIIKSAHQINEMTLLTISIEMKNRNDDGIIDIII